MDFLSTVIRYMRLKLRVKIKPLSIGIRVNPGMGVSRADNDKLQYAGVAATKKFGIYEEQLQEALSLAAHYSLKITKIRFHTGCGYLTAKLPQWDRVLGACLKNSLSGARTSPRSTLVEL